MLQCFVVYKKYFLSLLIAIICSLLVIPQTYASEDRQTKRVAGFSEKMIEKVVLFTKRSKPARFSYYVKLTEKRFSELEYVAENKKYEQLEQVASRYSTYLGVTSEYAFNNDMKDIKPVLNNMYERHSQVLPKLLEIYPHDSAYWLVIMHDINTIKTFQDKVSSWQ